MLLNQQQQPQSPQQQHLHQHAANKLYHHPNQRFLAIFLIGLILLQHAELFVCRHINTSSSNSNSNGSHKRARFTGNTAITSKTASIDDVSAATAIDKRTFVANGGNAAGGAVPGQPEEIFFAGDQMETNYDEYPMVVPKRAALLLDRLMVALHHALEKEHRRLSDFYGNNNNNDNQNVNMNEANLAAAAAMFDKPAIEHNDFEQGNANNMYSDDDPSVIMDYDFKDLNSINRATGETLMGKSFQRRANMGLHLGGGGGGVGGDADGIALLTSAAMATSDETGGGGGVRKNIGSGGGRMYWRCYFNAVSCF